MPPAPTRPILRSTRSAPLISSASGPSWRGPGQGRDRGPDRVREPLDVVVLVPLVPRQHEHRVEERVGTGAALASVVPGLGPGERERPSARAERPLLGEDPAREGGLLDVARRRRDTADAKL